MGCCSPEYRKVVKEQEEKVNKNTKETIPSWLKGTVMVITAVAMVILFLL